MISSWPPRTDLLLPALLCMSRQISSHETAISNVLVSVQVSKQVMIPLCDIDLARIMEAAASNTSLTVLSKLFERVGSHIHIT